MIAPHKSKRVKKRTQDARRLRRYERRWLVERFFAWLLVDRETQQSVIIMRDLVAGGARMCNALMTMTADDAAGTLTQLAGLHAGSSLLDSKSWIDHRISQMAKKPFLSTATIQELFDGPRGVGLPEQTRNAENLIAALKILAERDGQRPQSMVHGDCHAGNVFLTDQGPGFLDWQIIQRGGWSLYVAYHINALLPVDVAEKEEIRLLRHYLDVARGLGANVPEFETALSQYHESAVYGLFLWAVTRRVAPEITNMSNNRLGMAVTRHESYRRPGVC